MTNLWQPGQSEMVELNAVEIAECERLVRGYAVLDQSGADAHTAVREMRSAACANRNLALYQAIVALGTNRAAKLYGEVRA